MQIKLADNNDKKQWNDYVDKYSDIPPLSNFEWKEILEKSYKVKTHFFAALNDDNIIIGVCPAYTIRDIRGRKNLYSLKFALLTDNKDVLVELISYIKNFCNKNNIVSANISSGYKKEDIDCSEKIKTTHIIEIGENEESAWALLRDKTRNMIRKSIKAELCSEKGFHNLKDFYEIYAKNMLDKGIPINSYEFFLNIKELLKDKSELIVAKKGNEVVAGIMVLFSKNIAIYPYQSALRESLEFAPNQFLIWEAIRLCINKGIYRMDMGESKEGSSVYRFKSNFGGNPKNIYYYNIQAKNIHADAKTAPDKNEKNQRRLNLSIISSKVLANSPLWFGKRIGVWLKTKSKIL